MPKNTPVPRRRFVASALSVAAVAATPSLGLSARANPVVANEPATTLTPYLLFDGTCAEAMHFYQSVFGGELNLSKVKDSVMKSQMPPTLQEKVLNAHLRSATIEFSASDWLRRDRARVRGNTVCLYLSGGTQQQLSSIFEKLSDGAEVNDPLKTQPFGTYGALNDKFGVRWMFWTGEK
jgi:PhnB protein